MIAESQTRTIQQIHLQRLRERAIHARLRAAESRASADLWDGKAQELDAQLDRECGHKNQKRIMYEASNEKIICLDCGKVWWD